VNVLRWEEKGGRKKVAGTVVYRIIARENGSWHLSAPRCLKEILGTER